MNTNQAHIPMMSICGKRREMTLGRVVIDLMGCPCYLTMRISKNKDSLIFYPCKSTDALAIRVPDNMFMNRGARVRIISKEFVRELLAENGMDEVINYAIPGTYIEERGIIVLNMCPVRTVTFDREFRVVDGHRKAVRYEVVMGV